MVSRLVIICGLVGVLASVPVLQLLARRPGSRVPSLGSLVSSAMSWRVGRLPAGQLVLVVLWCWIGWHFLTRTR